MVLVAVSQVDVLRGKQALHPAWIEVYVVAGSAPDMSQVLDAQAQTPRPRRPEHQPVSAAREKAVIERLRKLLVVPKMIFPADSLLGHSRRAAGLKDIEGP